MTSPIAASSACCPFIVAMGRRSFRSAAVPLPSASPRRAGFRAAFRYGPLDLEHQPEPLLQPRDRFAQGRDRRGYFPRFFAISSPFSPYYSVSRVGGGKMALKVPWCNSQERSTFFGFIATSPVFMSISYRSNVRVLHYLASCISLNFRPLPGAKKWGWRTSPSCARRSEPFAAEPHIARAHHDQFLEDWTKVTLAGLLRALPAWTGKPPLPDTEENGPQVRKDVAKATRCPNAYLAPDEIVLLSRRRRARWMDLAPRGRE